ncbi:MAG: DUF1330 domain-containing protein [Pyrinomonadaceae bacterium]
MRLRRLLSCIPLFSVVAAGSSAAQGNTSTTMAYYIAEFEPTVPGEIQPYSARVESTSRPFGGRFIVRGGEMDSLEGTRGRLVIIAFDGIEQARAWYSSPAYEEIEPIRHRAGKSNVYIVPGVSQIDTNPGSTGRK